MTLLLKKLDPAITILLIEHDMDVAFEFAETMQRFFIKAGS